MHPDVMVSPRIAPQIIGVGLLEAIAEADIRANAADQAAAPGPIKGVPNQVWDGPAGRMMVGRFGWKANVATIAHQTGGAFLGDMGITSRHFAQEACTPVQKDCLTAPSGKSAGAHGQPEVEIDDKTLADVIFYQATLAPPARRNVNDAQVLRGQALFAQAQCATCHRPSYVTQGGPFPELTSKAVNGQRIWPYTDLLLHDMGPDLADNFPQAAASGKEWRTPPLWGLGLLASINPGTHYLHDGRARSIEEAILWHAGQGSASRDRFKAMTAKQRADLIEFVNSR
jgi:CxxC motif-containing protein (DUF1111 family)